MKLSFKDFMLKEMNVPGKHLDGNTGQNGNPVRGGAFLDSQQTGSETKSQHAGFENNGLSLYSTDLGLPLMQKPDTVIDADPRTLVIQLAGMGTLKIPNRQIWHDITQGKDLTNGTRVSVEYFTHPNDKSIASKGITGICII